MNKEHLHPDGRPYTKEEFINKIKTDDKFAKKFGELGKIYGYQWRNFNNEVDQITDLIKQLKENPDSRRILVSAWNPSDLPHQVLPPCHYGFQVYTRELSESERFNWYGNKIGSHMHHDHIVNEMDENSVPKRAISLMYNCRSQDVPLGTPFNIASYALLLEIIAKEVNMVPDELIANMGDCHIYLNQIDNIKEQLTREPYELPSLRINTEFWPTQTGECGEGPLSDNIGSIIDNMQINDFQIENYKSHPAIKMPLSN